MSEQVWYYSQHGERKGPVTLEVLQNALAHGKIDIATDLVWGPGLPEWVKVHEVPELQEMTAAPETDSPTPPPAGTPTPAADSSMSNIVPPSQVKAARAAENPYESPTADNALQEAMNARSNGQYTGIGRLAYFIWGVLLTVGLIVMLVVVFSRVEGQTGDASKNAALLMLGGVIFVGILSILLTFSRFKNLMMSRWNILWLIVPVMSIWVSYRLMVCPPGYHQHKQMDTSGKILRVLFIIYIVVTSTAPILFSGAEYYKEVADEAARQVEQQQLQETSE